MLNPVVYHGLNHVEPTQQTLGHQLRMLTAPPQLGLLLVKHHEAPLTAEVLVSEH